MLKRSRNRRDHLLGFALAHQAVIDEDAGELVADRLVDQHRRDRESTPPERPQITRPLPDLRADAGDRLGAESRHGPVAAAAADVEDEIAQSCAPCGVWTTSGWNCMP